MAAATAGRPAAAAPADDMDDLFDYNVNLDDIFRDVDTNMNVPARATNAAPPPAGRANSVGLGIDEEIKVRKARQPIAKLDEDRYVRCGRTSIHWGDCENNIALGCCPKQAYQSSGELQKSDCGSRVKAMR